MYLEESNAAPAKRPMSVKKTVPVVVKQEPTPDEMACAFFDHFGSINLQEFFSKSDLFNVREVIREVMQIETYQLDPEQTGYNSLPDKGFRFAYFPNYLYDEKNPHSFDPATTELVEAWAKRNDYFFYVDDAYAYVGIPEDMFPMPYFNKFKTAFEDA
jgi:hypothetical protein